MSGALIGGRTRGARRDLAGARDPGRPRRARWTSSSGCCSWATTKPGPVARECTEALAGMFGGRLAEGGQVGGCPLDAIGAASLVVIATAAERPSWGISDAVARALGGCQRPVLLVPVR